MKTFFKQSIVVLVMAGLLWILAQKTAVQVRYANLPKPVIAAVETRFPNCRKVSVTEDYQTGNYKIKIHSQSKEYLLEVDVQGQILAVNPETEAEIDRDATASLSRNASAQEEVSID